ASLTPQRVIKYHEIAMEAGLDVLVIQGTVVSGEHVSTVSEPLNLKEFIPTLDVPVVVGGCASYHTGLHLMRTGAAGVLVGVGPGHLPPDSSARRAGGDDAERHARGDPRGPGAGERRHVQPVWRAAHVDGDVRAQGSRRVQPGRGRDRAGYTDRGQGAPARPR